MLQRETYNLTIKSLSTYYYCCSFHPTLAMITTTSGQRSYKSSILDSDSDQSDTDSPEAREDNSVRLWWIGP